MRRIPNPDLAVGAGNKQRWNQPEHRRHGFHNAHGLFRRALMLRAGQQAVLEPGEDSALAGLPALATLTDRPEFSALVCACEGQIVLARHASDFGLDRPHSIQSVTKLFMHLVAGRLMGEGLLDPERRVEHYLPEIGSGYRGARVQDVLDMTVRNDFVEDYSDPEADSFAEEVALGWRLPRDGAAEIRLHDFVCAITGGDLSNPGGYIHYCSANTDLLTLICDRLAPGRLPGLLMEAVEAAGLEGAFHVSLSPEGLPAFSGGGCLSAADLARFGLMLLRVARGEEKGRWNGALTRRTRDGASARLSPPRDFVRYANQMMTDGRWIGHAGYGGQFLMADTRTGLSCAYLSVLENDSGYCEAYMTETILCLQALTERYAQERA
ncbi:MAG: serine hydrolase domain-containing protein [Roseovarius sp.]